MATKFLEFKYTDHDGNERTLNLYAKEMEPLRIEDHPEWTTITTSSLRWHASTTANHWFQWEEINGEVYYVSRTGTNSSWVTCSGCYRPGGYSQPIAYAFTSRLEQYSTEIKYADPSLEQNRHIIKLTSPSDRSNMFYADGTFDETPPTNPYIGQELTYINDEGVECTANFAFFVRDQIIEGVPTPIAYNSGIYGFTPPGGILGSNGGQYLNTSHSYSSQDPPAIGIWHTTVKCDQEGAMQPGVFGGGDGDLYGTEFPVFVMVWRNGTDQTSVAIIPESIFHAVDASEPTTDTPDDTNVTPSGWTGGFDFSSDSDSHVTPTGFGWANQWPHGINIYNLTSAEVGSFLDCMWDFSITKQIKKKIDEMFAGANTKWLQGIVSLHILPCTVQKTGNSQLITIFGQYIGPASGTKMYTGTSQHIVTIESEELPIGNTLPKNVFLDYENCSAYVKLPFVGQVPVDIRKFRDGSLQVTYDIDVLTGNCVAQIYATSKTIPGYTESTGKKILIYQGSGNCAIHIPYCGNTEGGAKQLQAVAGIGMAAIGAATGVGLAVGGGLASTFSSPTSNTEEHSYLASEAGPMMHPYVKLVVEGPVPLVPKSQQKDWGFKAFTTATVREFVNYPQKQKGKEFLQGKIHCNIPNATDAEKKAIEAWFEKGVLV